MLHEVFPQGVPASACILLEKTKSYDVAIVYASAHVLVAELCDTQLAGRLPAAAAIDFGLASVRWRHWLDIAMHYGACGKRAQVLLVRFDYDSEHALTHGIARSTAQSCE